MAFEIRQSESDVREDNASTNGSIAANHRTQALRVFVRSYFTPAGKTAAWNLVWLIMGTVVSQACGLSVVLLLTRALEPRYFGIYAFAVSLYTYMVLLGSAGLEPIIIRELNRRPSKTDQISTAYFVISLTAGLLIAVGTGIGVRIANASDDEMLLLLCMAASNTITCGRMLPFFDVLHRQSLTALMTSAADLLWLAAIVYLDVKGILSLSLIGIAFSIKWAFLNTAPALIYHFRYRRLRIRINVSEIRCSLGSAWYLLLVQLATMIPVTSGVFVVRYFHGDAAAGVMGLAVLVAQTYLQLIAIALRIIYPHITGPHGAESLFRKKMWSFFLSYTALLFLLVAGGLVIIVKWILIPSYTAVLSVGLVMMIGAVPAAVATLRIQLLVSVGRVREVFLAQLFSTCTFVMLVIPGAYYWSHLGVACAFCVSGMALMASCWGMGEGAVVLHEQDG